MGCKLDKEKNKYALGRGLIEVTESSRRYTSWLFTSTDIQPQLCIFSPLAINFITTSRILPITVTNRLTGPVPLTQGPRLECGPHKCQFLRQRANASCGGRLLGDLCRNCDRKFGSDAQIYTWLIPLIEYFWYCGVQMMCFEGSCSGPVILSGVYVCFRNQNVSRKS